MAVSAVAVLGAVAGCAVAALLFARPRPAPAPAPAPVELAAFSPAVIDGETLRLGDQVVRLRGVGAPSRGTDCGGTDCGAASANALAALVRGRRVGCRIEGRDPAGRPSGICVAGGIRLNEAQVRAGWAHAGAPALRPEEEVAKAAHIGLWRETP